MGVKNQTKLYFVSFRDFYNYGISSAYVLGTIIPIIATTAIAIMNTGFNLFSKNNWYLWNYFLFSCMVFTNYFWF